MNNKDAGVITIYIPDYNKLVNENNELKKENEILRNRITDLSSIIEHIDKEIHYVESIKYHEQTIEELKKENEMLKSKIKELEDKIKQQDDHIKQQDDNIKQQNITINILKEKINAIETKSLYNKYLMAIQDLNREEELETKLNTVSKNLNKLRKNRIGEVHYLNEDMDEWDLVDRKSVLYDKLINMPIEIKQKFDKLYPNVVDSVINHIKSAKTHVTDEYLEEIEEWWNF